MCETMTAMEEATSYILTEDMIDAAMTEQFTFQDGGESDDEQSSQEDVEMHSSSNDDTSDKDLNQRPVPDSNQNLADDSEALCETNSVLVIDAGLGLNELNIVSETGDSAIEKDQSGKIQLPIETPSTSTNIPSSCSQVIDCQDEIMNNVDEIKHDELPESAQMSNENPPSREPGVSQLVESIDLCNSDSEELSADDVPAGELIDGDLQSVMESNLMAEIGMKLPATSADLEPTKSVMPKISVKNIGHISANDFDKIPTNTLDLPHVSVEKRRSVKVVSRSPEISVAGKDASTSIQLNKIAVPNKTFVNSQGRKMKCVYVRAPTTLPVNVTNDNRSLSSKKNVKYVFAPSSKNGTLQLAPAPVEPSKKRASVGKTKPGNSKMLMIAPKLIKGPDILKGSPNIHRFDRDENNDTLVRSLLFHSLKTPYVPLESFPGDIIHSCADCNDRFTMESSLKHHLARRTITIGYWCRVCKIEIQCFNRCIFLSHLRAHNISRTTIDTACVTFRPISEEMSEAGLVSTYFTEPSGSLPKEDRIVRYNTVPGNANDAPSKPTEKPKPALREWTLPQESPATKSLITYSNKNALTVSKRYSNVKTYVQSKSVGTLTSSIAAPVNNSLLLSNNSKSAQDQPVKVAMPVDKNIRTFNHQTAATADANEIPNVIAPDVVCEIVTQENGEGMDKNVDDVESTPIDNARLVLQGTRAAAAKKPNILKKPKISQQNNAAQAPSLKRLCTECKVTVVNITKHLSGSTRMLNPTLACEVCHLILPTRCALAIHLRVHMQVPPFKCPDCGKEFSSLEEQTAHLKYACGHLAKCMRFMCVACKTHFPSTSALANHISSQHSKDIYKCTACPVAFFNKSSLTKHLYSHPHNSAIGMDYKQCSICPKKVVPTERFMDHVDEHITNRAIMIYGYKCPMCSVIFANKMPFIIHQMKEKDEMEGKSDSVPKHVRKKTTTYPDPSSELEDEPEIVSKYPEAFNGNAEEKDPLSLDDCELPRGQTVDEKKEELCIVCKKNYVVLLPDIDLNEQSLCCRQCVKPLDEVADKRSDSFGKSGQKIPPKTKNREPNLNRRRSSDVSAKSDTPNGLKDCVESSPPKKKHKKKSSAISWDIFDPLDPTQMQGQVITSKSPNELICSKCDFTAEVREVFLEHISVHRTDPNTFQCIECGLCFVVLPSLERHLQMNHGINNVNDYTEHNPYSLPQVPALEEDVLVDDNQCRVCRQTFDSPPSLEKHFRTHGMAFMNSLSKSP